jgi:hypothetical protein
VAVCDRILELTELRFRVSQRAVVHGLIPQKISGRRGEARGSTGLAGAGRGGELDSRFNAFGETEATSDGSSSTFKTKSFAHDRR